MSSRNAPRLQVIDYVALENTSHPLSSYHEKSTNIPRLLDITEKTALAPISYNKNLRDRILKTKCCNLPTGLSCTSATPLALPPLPGQSINHQATDALVKSTTARITYLTDLNFRRCYITGHFHIGQSRIIKAVHNCEWTQIRLGINGLL